MKSALSRPSCRRSTCPATAIQRFRKLLRSPDPQDVLAKIIPSTSRPWTTIVHSSFTPCSRAMLLNFLKQGGLSADYKINRALPLLFELVAISMLAIVVVLAFPPLTARRAAAGRKGRARIFAVLSMHWRGIYFDSGRADPEVHTLPGPSHVCINGDYFFDVDFERPGQLLEPAFDW